MVYTRDWEFADTETPTEETGTCPNHGVPLDSEGNCTASGVKPSEENETVPAAPPVKTTPTPTAMPSVPRLETPTAMPITSIPRTPVRQATGNWFDTVQDQYEQPLIPYQIGANPDVKNIYKQFGIPESKNVFNPTLPTTFFSHNVPLALWLPNNTIVKANNPEEFGQLVTFAQDNFDYLPDYSTGEPNKTQTVEEFAQFVERNKKYGNTPEKQELDYWSIQADTASEYIIAVRNALREKGTPESQLPMAPDVYNMTSDDWAKFNVLSADELTDAKITKPRIAGSIVSSALKKAMTAYATSMSGFLPANWKPIVSVTGKALIVPTSPTAPSKPVTTVQTTTTTEGKKFTSVTTTTTKSGSNTTVTTKTVIEEEGKPTKISHSTKSTSVGGAVPVSNEPIKLGDGTHILPSAVPAGMKPSTNAQGVTTLVPDVTTGKGDTSTAFAISDLYKAKEFSQQHGLPEPINWQHWLQIRRLVPPVELTQEQHDILQGRTRVTEANKEAAVSAGVPRDIAEQAAKEGVNVTNIGWSPTDGELAKFYDAEREKMANPVTPVMTPSVEMEQTIKEMDTLNPQPVAAAFTTSNGWKVTADNTYFTPEGVPYTSTQLILDRNAMNDYAAQFSEQDKSDVVKWATNNPEDFMALLKEHGDTPETRAMFMALYPSFKNEQNYKIWRDMNPEDADYFFKYVSLPYQNLDKINEILKKPATPETARQLQNIMAIGDPKAEVMRMGEWWGKLFGKSAEETYAQNEGLRQFVVGGGQINSIASGIASMLGNTEVGKQLSEKGKAMTALSVDRMFKPEMANDWKAVFMPEWWHDTAMDAIAMVPLGVSMAAIGVAFAPVATAAGVGAGALVPTTAMIAGRWALAPVVSTVVESLIGGTAMTILNSGMEAGSVYDEATQRGYDTEQANQAAQKVFLLTLAEVVENPLEFLWTFANPLKNVKGVKGTKGGRLITAVKTAGKGLALSLLEGGEEVYESWAESVALGDEFDISDPEVLKSLVLGGLMGGLTFSVMDFMGKVSGGIETRISEKTRRQMNTLDAVYEQEGVGAQEFQPSTEIPTTAPVTPTVGEAPPVVAEPAKPVEPTSPTAESAMENLKQKAKATKAANKIKALNAIAESNPEVKAEIVEATKAAVEEVKQEGAAIELDKAQKRRAAREAKKAAAEKAQKAEEKAPSGQERASEGQGSTTTQPTEKAAPAAQPAALNINKWDELPLKERNNWIKEAIKKNPSLKKKFDARSGSKSLDTMPFEMRKELAESRGGAVINYWADTELSNDEINPEYQTGHVGSEKKFIENYPQHFKVLYGYLQKHIRESKLANRTKYEGVAGNMLQAYDRDENGSFYKQDKFGNLILSPEFTALRDEFSEYTKTNLPELTPEAVEKKYNTATWFQPIYNNEFFRWLHDVKGYDALDIGNPDGSIVIFDKVKVQKAANQEVKETASGVMASVFASVNTREENMTLDEAIVAIDSPEQNNFVKVSTDIANHFGITDPVNNGIGDWKDGAEHTTIVEVTSTDDKNAVKATAAYKGLEGNQKQVLTFYPSKKGDDIMYTLNVPNGDIKAIAGDLDKAGIQYKTFALLGKTVRVMIVDEKGANFKKIELLGDKYNVKINANRGTQEKLGDPKGDSRIVAKREYRRTLRELEEISPNYRYDEYNKSKGIHPLTDSEIKLEESLNEIKGLVADGTYDPALPSKISKALNVFSDYEVTGRTEVRESLSNFVKNSKGKDAGTIATNWQAVVDSVNNLVPTEEAPKATLKVLSPELAELRNLKNWDTLTDTDVKYDWAIDAGYSQSEATIISNKDRMSLTSSQVKKLKEVSGAQNKKVVLAQNIKESEQKLQAALEGVSDISKKRVRSGVDPEMLAQSFKVYKELVNLAKLHIQMGVTNATEFAAKIGMKLNYAIQRAWDEASGKLKSFDTIPRRVHESITKELSQQRPVESAGEEKVGAMYDRVKDEFDTITKEDFTYNEMSIKEQVEKAIDYVNNNPESSERIAYGVEPPPEGITQEAISIAFANKLMAEGNGADAGLAVISRSMRQRRRGQEIVMERGSVSEHSPTLIINRVLDDKIESVGKKIKGSGTSQSKVNSEIKKQAKTLRDMIKLKQEDIVEAQKLLEASVSKSAAPKIITAIKNGEISINDLYNMKSPERHKALAKYMTDAEATKVNAAFEKAMLSIQKKALQNWVDKVLTSEEKATDVYKDLKKKIDTLDKMGALSPETSEDFLSDLIASKMGVRLTEEQLKEITSRASTLEVLFKQNVNRPPLEYWVARSKLDKYIQAITPSHPLRVITSIIGRGNLLFSVKSPLTNIISNTVQGGLHGMERRMGQKGYRGSNKDYAIQYVKDVVNIYQKSGYDISRMDKDWTGQRRLGEQVTSAQGKTAIHKVGQFYEDIVFKELMGFPDVVSSAIAFADSVNINSTTIAIKEGKKGADVKARALELFEDAANVEPTTAEGVVLRAQAIEDARITTYTNKDGNRSLAGIALSFRNMINSATGDIRLGDQIMPFVMTPANVVQAGIDATGINPMLYWDLAKAIRSSKVNPSAESKAEMSKVITRFVRAGLGVSIAFILAHAFDPDDFLGAYETIDQNGKDRAALKNASYNSVKLGGKWVSMDYFGALAAPMIGIMYARKYGENFLEKAYQYGRGVSNQLLQVPAVWDFADIMGTFQQAIAEFDVGKSATKMSGDAIDFTRSRIIPAITYDAVKGSDVYERVTSGAFGRVKASTPFVRTGLQPKTSLGTGEPIKTSGFISTVLFGSRIKTASDNALIAEVERLASPTVNESPTITDIRITKGRIQTLKEQIGEDKFNEAVDYYNKTYATAASKKINTTAYKKLPDAKKKAALDGIRSDTLEETLKKYKYKAPVK